MACIRNISIAHALSYFNDDMKKKEAKGFDYYSQEDSGVWFGKTAERLGLTEKSFLKEDFKNMMEGKFSYQDQKTGKIIQVDLEKHSGHKKHQAGVELTLSAPKSVSIMAEVFKDKRIVDCHIMACNNVLNYIQDNLVYTRSSINGKMVIEKVDNVIASKFTHHTNRNHDPQLHSHILIQNIILDKNNKIKTGEFSEIFANERFLRELYNAELVFGLQKAGYEITWEKKVTQIAPEIASVPKELTDLFSTRRKEIEELAKKDGINLTDYQKMQELTLKTRQKKDNTIGLDQLSPVWNEKIQNLGINIEDFKEKLYQKNKNKLNIDLNNSNNFTIIKNNQSTENKYIKELDKNLEKLFSMEAVTNLTGKEFPNNNESLIDRVSAYYDSMGGVVKREDIEGFIKLNRRGVKDSSRHGLSSLKAAAFIAVPDIIKNGIIIDKQLNWKNRNYNTYIILAPININNERYIAEGIVIESNDGNKRFYLHEVEKDGKLQDYLMQGPMSTEASSKLNLALFIQKVKEIQNIKIQIQEKQNDITLKQAVNDSVEHITERQLTFTKEELIINIINRSNGSYNIKEIEKEIKNNKELISNQIEVKEYAKHLSKFNERAKEIFTTNTQLENEKFIYNNIIESKNTLTPLLNNKEIKNLSNNNEKTYNFLNDNQKINIHSILKNKDQFYAIQGFAGVGKTYTIKALNEILKEKNIQLIGLAPTNSATATLCQESKIETQTLQSFLLKYDGYANNREKSSLATNTLKNDFKNKIVLVDESSLISNTQMKNLVAIAKKLDIRVILQGDEKQLDSVEAGTPFQRLVKNKIINHSELTNILRQNDLKIKEAVYEITKQNVKESFKILQENNNIIELRNNEQIKNLDKEKIKKDLVNNVVDKYFSYNKEEREKTLIVTSSNEIRRELNDKIRDKIKTEIKLDKEIKEIVLETLEQKSLTNQEKKEIKNYDLNNVIIFTKNNEKNNIIKNEEYKIVELQEKNNNLVIVDKNNNLLNINIKKEGKNINLYKVENKEFIENDLIKWTNTDKNQGILKGDNLIIKKINKEKEESTITFLNTKNNKEIKLNLNNENDNKTLKHLDYNYVTTSYSSQGKTSQNVILTLESYRQNLTTQKDFYVGVSRTKDNLTIITDNINASINTLIGNHGNQLSAIDIDKNKISIDSNNTSINQIKKNELELDK